MAGRAAALNRQEKEEFKLREVLLFSSFPWWS